MKQVFAILRKENGEIKNKKVIREMFYKLKDGRYQVEVHTYDKRTNQQNKYLHGVLIPEFRKALVSVGYGEVKDDVQSKKIIKSMFLKRRIVNKETGEVIEYVQDTSDCTKEELGVLIEEVIAFASEHMNYQIPHPNEQLTMYQ